MNMFRDRTPRSNPLRAGILAIALGLAVAMAWAMPVDAEEMEVADLTGKHVAFLVGDGFHDLETLAPMAHLVNRGAQVTVIGVEPAVFQAYNSDVKVRIHTSVNDVSIDDFDGMVIPGGRSPAWLREHEEIVDFVREFVEAGKVVAAICHGPQVLVSAGVMDGVNATCVGGISDELTEAGANYEDAPVMRDGNIITSRIPNDLPVFNVAIEEALAEG